MLGNTMSRLSKKPIAIPERVEITKDGNTITVKGPKGELSRSFKSDVIAIIIENNLITFEKQIDTVFSRALIGTYASHIKNMIHGVIYGFEKKLIIEGVGFRSEVKGNTLEMTLGFSHLVILDIPEDIILNAEKNNITVSGIDKERTMQFAAQIRAQKKPEPYKGKGIRYEGEIIRRKQGKKSA